MLRVIFVCSGNICRSPMAQVVFSEAARTRGVDHLSISMGTLGLMNAPAADEAIAACADRGIDLRAHRSQGLNRMLLQRASHVFVMEAQHRDAVVARGVDPARVHYLGAFDPEDPREEIDDPVDQSQEVFEACLDRIVRAIDSFLDGASV